MKKIHLLTLATVGVLTAGIVGATQISAQDDGKEDKVFLFSTHKGEHMSSLIQKLATKFGVSEDEVQAVFDEEHKEMEKNMEVRYEDRLSQLVSDGKITEEQKALILAKHKELRENRETNFESMKNMTHEERRALMEEKHAELESWAEENDIDPQYLMVMHKMKSRGGPGMDGPPDFEKRID